MSAAAPSTGRTGQEPARHPRFAGWLAGPVAVGLAAVAHLASGASPPALPIVAAAAALLSMAGSMIARLRLPGWFLLLLAGLGQQGLHLLFAGATAAALPGTAAGHGHRDSADAFRIATGGTPDAGDPGLMLHAHLAAALLTALLLAKLSVTQKITKYT